MKYAYLVLASERRVLNLGLDDDLDAIPRILGCHTIEHGTTLSSEDHLIISGDEADHKTDVRFWVCGVPFPFHNAALLVGVDSLTGDTADRPAMPIDEFQRLITFATPSHDWRLPMRFTEALENANLRGGC